MKKKYVCMLCIGLSLACAVSYAGNCLCKKSVAASYSGSKMECQSSTSSSISGELTGVGSGAVSGEGTMSAVCILAYEVVPTHYNCYDEGSSNTTCDDDGSSVTQHNYSGGSCVYDNGIFGIGAHYDCTDLTDDATSLESATGTACSE